MARAGGRAGRMFSSGRLAGPVTLSHTKRRTNVRKASVTSVDSLYSTDSEDQVLVINKGLDRCAALLQDILQSDVTENTKQNLSCRGSAWQPLMKGKRSVGRKTSSACHAYKDSASLRKSGPSGVRGKGVKTLQVNAPQRLVSPHSHISQPALCEHVQTQMSRLTSDQGPECAPLYNNRLPTSTPALSPGDASRAQNARHEVLPQGGAAHLPPGIVAPIVYVPTSGQYHPAMPTAPQQPCQTDNVPHLIANDKCVRECDFLQHVAARLAQLQVSGDGAQTLPKAEYSSSPARYVRETDEASSGEEENDAPARNISCQTSFEKNLRTKSSSTEKIQTVTYLLGEIKALVSDHDDREVMRLISELEHSVSLLPAVVGNTNFHAELALTLQPLRSENAQLRRRLRILNQQLRDRERQDRGERSDACNAEVISFQTLNMALQNQLDESRKDVQSLQSKTQELLRVMEAQQEENQKLAQTVQDKDQALRLILWQQEDTATRTKTDLDESLKMKLESCEKENKVLEVTLRQRDGEVSRLRELTRTLQASMAKLLCDLGRDHGKSRTGGNLTRDLLDSYEKQLREENIPASASIINYLKQVKTEQALPSRNPDCPSVSNTVSSTGTGRCLTPEDHTEPDQSQPNHLLPASSILHPGPRSATCTESCLSTYDETTYLPLNSSPHKAQLVPSQRHMCTPPMADMGARVREPGAAYCCSLGDRDVSQNGGEFGFKKTLQPSLNKMHLRTKPPEGGNPRAEDQSEPGLARYPLTQPTKSLEDKGHNLAERAMSDFMSGKPDWTMTSFSTFTSHDEQDFRNGLAALDANIAKLHYTLQAGMLRK